MFSFIKSIVDLFNGKESYSFESMSLRRGRGSDFWTSEKESKMLELFSKNYSYEDVGRAIGATRGQLATRVRMLRQKGIEVNGTSTVKTQKYKTTKSMTQPTKQSTKQIVDDVIKQLK